MGRGRKIKINDLGKVVSEILQEYGNNVTAGTKKAVLEVAKIAQQETKAGSPVKSGGYGNIKRKQKQKPGSYRRGWAVREDVLDRFRTDAIVYNRTDYQLTHLLEKGHDVKNRKGGPVIGHARAIPHIEPAEQHAIKNLQEAVKRIAQEG